MKVSRGALIFAGIIVAIVLLVAGFAWFSSLFKPTATGAPSAVQDFFSSLFPFGTTTRQTAGGNGENGGGSTGPVPDLRKVSVGPIAGLRFTSDGALLYGERESGHIYRTATSSLDVTRLTNTTIPAIHGFIWLNDSAVVLEYAGSDGTVRDYYAAISTTTEDQTLLGHFLPVSGGVLPGTDDKSYVFFSKGASGTTVNSAHFDGTASSVLFASPLRSWIALPTSGGLYMETAPSSVPGFLYRTDGKGGLTRILGNVPGLMTVPDSTGRYIAYSYSGRGGTQLAVLDTKTNTTYQSPVATYAEKCAWIPGTAPALFCGVPSNGISYSIEQWYAGLAASSDDAWVIDPVAGTATALKELAPNANQTIDMYQPAVSPDGTFASFLNKGDLSLWLLKIK